MSAYQQINDSYTRCAPARLALTRDIGARCLEVTTDKAGIVWERYILPSGVVVVLYATPDFWDIYAPVCSTNSTVETLAAVKALA